MKQINLHTLRIDGGTQAREELNQDTVAEYAELMRDGHEFPPMVAFHDGSDYWLADGFHRYFAHKQNGSSLVEVDNRTGTRDDAVQFSWGANKGRGLPPNPRDIRKIIASIMKHPEASMWTNSKIAQEVGVSSMTVGRIKKQLEPQDNETTIKQYQDKNGVVREVDTAKLATKKAVDKPTAERPVGTKPDSSTINEDKIALSMMADQLNELSETIGQLSEENTLLRDKIAVGQWDASEIEKIDIQDTVNELREQIRILEIENKSLREGRDMYQNQAAELMRVNKSLQARIKKLEA